jgi:hypothetical protein
MNLFNEENSLNVQFECHQILISGLKFQLYSLKINEKKTNAFKFTKFIFQNKT